MLNRKRFQNKHKKEMKTILGVLIFILFLNSCRKSTIEVTTPVASSDSVWYPLYISNWWVYKVDSSRYKKSSNDSIVTIVHTSSYLKEEVVETVDEFSEGISYKLALYHKTDINAPWVFDRYSSIRIQKDRFIKKEGSDNYMKLFFPIKNNTSWLGNQYIHLEESNQYLENWNYTYTDLNLPKTYNSLPFDTTVTVLQVVDSNAIEKKYSVEQYAKKVGLIYSEFILVEKQDATKTWATPENGFKVTKTIIDYKR